MTWASGDVSDPGANVRNFICPSIALVASLLDDAGAEQPPDAFTKVFTP